MKTVEFIQQKKIILTLCLLLSYQVIFTLINMIDNLFVPPGFIWDTVFLYFLLFILILPGVFVVLKLIKNDYLIFFVLLGSIYLLSMLINNGLISIYESNITRVFITSLSIYLYGRSITNFKLLYFYLEKTSIVVIISSLIMFLISLIHSSSGIEYMVFSYNILFFLSFLTLLLFTKFNIFNFLITIIGFLLILIAGARGALVSYLVIVILGLIIKNKFKVRLIISLIIGISIIAIFQNTLLNYLDKLLLSEGINSRTITILVNGDFYNSSGRFQIYNYILEGIKTNPFGGGIFYDSAILSKHYSLGPGLYSHNLFLQVFSEYGLIFGLCLIIFLFYNIGKALINKNFSFEAKILILALISASIIKLMYTGNYLTEPYFYLLIAILMTVNYDKRKRGFYENPLDMQYTNT